MIQRLLKNSTTKVAEALQMAIMELANMNKSVVGAEMVLAALFEQKDSIVTKIIMELKLDPAPIRRAIVDIVMAKAQELPNFASGQVSNLKLSEDLVHLFEAANKERQRLGDEFISTGALFLACFDKASPNTEQLLTSNGMEHDVCLTALERIHGNNKVSERDAESRQRYLDEYTTDITALARRGQLDPVVGRDEEIDRVIQILSRRKKNNPILIGEPGVGKTVIVEGLAQKIATADVPEYLLNKRVLSLEIGSLIAGAKMQGEFEERLKRIKDEITAAAGEIILFIDEIHTVVGAGRSGGGLDASNMLKPALAKGILQCIGATTLKEYKQYIESDKALERRFQPVKVEQPSVGNTIEILRGLQPRYESHHQINYTSDALKAAAELSDRYLPDRFLPDKAVDLMDEAGAAKRLKVIYTPPEVRHLETRKHELLNKKAEAFNSQDFENMAKHQMELSRLETELAQEHAKFAKKVGPEDRRVDVDDIAEIISKQTGIPVKKMVEQEAQRLLDLEGTLQKRVIGQSHAVKSVASAIRRNRAGLRKANAPIASFLFLGPTGVGKTELAKAIAAEVLDNESRIIRIDMSEYMERHEIAKLIGSPPGYVGHGEGGQLTEQVRRQPYSVVLFDEFEKAHPDIFNIMLQILDEGWLTDSEGRRVSFQNCVIIGTSNIGSGILSEKKRPVGIGAQSAAWDEKQERGAINDELKKFFRPEFLNRIDEVIIFNSLGKDNLRAILDLQVADLTKRLERMNIKLEFSGSAKDLLLASIDNNNYGARPIKRKLEQAVENEIATILISNPGKLGIQVTVDSVDGKLQITNKH